MTPASINSDSRVPWPGRSGTGSLILPLDAAMFSGLPPRLSLPEVALARKPEFHLTLLSTGEAAAIEERLPERDWRAVFDARQWSPGPPLDFWLLREDKDGQLVWSVIARVRCDALGAFRQAMSEASGTPLPHAPPHVTLYASAGSRGIGLSSDEDFERFRIRRLAVLSSE